MVGHFLFTGRHHHNKVTGGAIPTVWNTEEPVVKILSLSEGQKIYITLDGRERGGTYGVKVSLVP